MPGKLHEVRLIGRGKYWDCACGEVYPVEFPDGSKGRHPEIEKVQVILFRESGKYYTEEYWRIPEGAIGPYDMLRSPDFRRIDHVGPVLIPTQEPWGFPHIFPAPVLQVNMV